MVGVCSFDGCNRDIKCKGLCAAHYSQHETTLCHSCAGRERNRKLTDHEVATIRSLWRGGGLMKTEIADMFNITPTNVASIVNYEIWKHLP